ncbi:unnamed protein product [Auanema sp. JU1783]|nr:unnamed protein product [Auanema sp. JU1783]
MSGAPDVIPVRVCVRCRPFNQRENNEKATECLQFFIEANQLSCNGKMFTFDSVMDPGTDQQSAYELTVLSLLDSFLKGFNCTILAYGQTGSGKTYTMGTAETTESITSNSRGIVPRFVEDLFNRINALTSEHETYKVTVSMLEIYDEKIRDLLTTAPRDREGLQAREINGIVSVPGLSVREVDNLRQTMAALEEGCQQRSMGETAMNAVSSRSHAIFRIDLEKTSLSDEAGPSFKAKLHLVDLAGSERIKKTQAEGTRLKEGIRINEGLLALGNVISALSEPGGNNRHIPYRDSKITRLLQDSLGGNSYTVMIACISPADTNAEETLSTLRYADRAKKIKNKPVVIVDQDKNIIKQLKEQLVLLQREIAEIRGGGTIIASNANTTIDSTELNHLREALAEKERLLSQEGSKAAEAMIQKLSVMRKLIKLEEDREKLVVLLKEATIESEAASILKQIQDILDVTGDDVQQDSSEYETAPMSSEDSEDGELDEDTAEKNKNRANELDRDLQDIYKQIQEREMNLKRATEDNENYVKLLKSNEAEMTALQQKIDNLTSQMGEKEHELRKQNSGNKIAEDRRKKLQDMDKQLQMYKKQMADMKRVEAEKIQCEENMKKMNKEITDLKQTRVRMMKQAKEEINKHLRMKAKMEKEVAQLKAKERKREGEFARETRANVMKVAILKQKLEESKKLTKRLENQRSRVQANFNDMMISDEKSLKVIKATLMEELILLASGFEAELMCTTLKDQRKKIVSRISRLKTIVDDLVRKNTTDDGELNLNEDDYKKHSDSLKEIESLESQQEFCSAELKSLQEGCTKVDPDRIFEMIKEKNIHTVASATKFLKIVIEALVQEKKNCVELQLEIKSYKQKCTESEREIKDLKLSMRKQAAEFKAKEKEIQENSNQKFNALEEKYSSLLSVVSNPVRDEKVTEELGTIINEAMNYFAENKTQKTTKSKKKSSIQAELAPLDDPPLSKRQKQVSRKEWFGDVRDTLEAVCDENDPNPNGDKTLDNSWHPAAARKRKPRATDISPIKADETENARRRSRFVDKTEPAKLHIEDMENIVEEMPMAGVNTTFVKSSSVEKSSPLNSEQEQISLMRPLRVKKFSSPSLGQRPI